MSTDLLSKRHKLLTEENPVVYQIVNTIKASYNVVRSGNIDDLIKQDLLAMERVIKILSNVEES